MNGLLLSNFGTRGILCVEHASSCFYLLHNLLDSSWVSKLHQQSCFFMILTTRLVSMGKIVQVVAEAQLA